MLYCFGFIDVNVLKLDIRASIQLVEMIIIRVQIRINGVQYIPLKNLANRQRECQRVALALNPINRQNALRNCSFTGATNAWNACRRS